MKKRFSSLKLSDLATWLMAIGAYAFLAAAGLAIGWLRKGNVPDFTPPHASRLGSRPAARSDTQANLTPGA